MKKVSSGYAHLPYNIIEYKKIIDVINDGMTVNELDNVIAEIKNKESVDHHYRGSLRNLGVFSINNRNKIELDEISMKIKKGELSLKDGLAMLIKKKDDLVDLLNAVNCIKLPDNARTIDVARSLTSKYCSNAPLSIKRWIEPLLYLFDYTELLNFRFKRNNGQYKINRYQQLILNLQEAYLSIEEFGEAVPIKKIENILKQKYGIDQNGVQELWEALFRDKSLLFRFSFVTYPDLKNKYGKILISDEAFTHIKIKSNLIDGVN